MTSERQTTNQIIPGYEILKKLGQGGMGAVYMARQESMDRIVAMKVLPRSLAKQAEFKERFFREARAAGKLNHPNIVAAIDAQEAAGYCYIVMEFVEGSTVASILSAKGALPESEALSIIHQIGEALAHAWAAGIVHRDVKPENFLYTRDGVAKLCDLGIAKAPSDAGLTQDGTALGTPRYIAPEQARGLDTVDFRADIYSLGASLYHMLAGEPPYDGPTSAAIMLKHVNEPLPSLKRKAPNASRGVVLMVERMMAKDPKKRYQKAEDLLADIAALREGRLPPGAASGKASTSGRKTAVRRVAPAVAPRSSVTRAPRRSDTGTYVVLGIVGAAALAAFLLWPKAPTTGNGSSSSQTASTNSGSSSPGAEEEARATFLRAKDLHRRADLHGALDLYRSIVSRWPTSSFAAEAAKLEKDVLAEINADARLKRANEALAQLREKKPPMTQAEAMRTHIAKLRAFADDPQHAGQPADTARGEANALDEQLASFVNPPQDPQERLRENIQKARKLLAGEDWAVIERILETVANPEIGRGYAELAPDIERLGAVAKPSAVRIQCLRALAQAAPAAAKGMSVRMLTDRNEGVRLEAIQYIQRNRLTEAVPVLERLAKLETRDPSPRVASAAQAAIDRLRR